MASQRHNVADLWTMRLGGVYLPIMGGTHEGGVKTMVSMQFETQRADARLTPNGGRLGDSCMCVDRQSLTTA
jgi:hypothetical protein